MLYKRYIKRKGKVYGPYTYHSIRTKDGKVKNIYVKASKEKKPEDKEETPKETKPKKFSFFKTKQSKALRASKKFHFLKELKSKKSELKNIAYLGILVLLILGIFSMIPTVIGTTNNETDEMISLPTCSTLPDIIQIPDANLPMCSTIIDDDLIQIPGLPTCSTIVDDDDLISIPQEEDKETSPASPKDDEDLVSIPVAPPSSSVGSDDDELISIPENTAPIGIVDEEDDLFSIPKTPNLTTADEDELFSIPKTNLTTFGTADVGDPSTHCTINATDNIQAADHYSCNNLTIEAGGIFNMSIYNLTAAGNVVIAGDLNGGNGNHSFVGTLGISAGGTYNATTNTTTVGGRTTVSGTFNANSGNLSLDTGGIGGLYVPTNGVFDGGSGDHIIGGSILSTSSTVTLTSGTTILDNQDTSLYVFRMDEGGAGTTTLDANGGTIVVNTAGPNKNFRVGLGNSVYNLVVNNSGMELEIQTYNLTVDNDLTINTGEFNTNDGTSDHNLTVIGDVEVNGTLSGTTADHSFGSLTINSGGTYSATTGTTTITSEAGTQALDCDGTFTHNNGLVNITTTASTRSDFVCTGNLYDLEVAMGSTSNFLELGGGNNEFEGNVTVTSGVFSNYGYQTLIKGHVNAINTGRVHANNNFINIVGNLTIEANSNATVAANGRFNVTGDVVIAGGYTGATLNDQFGSLTITSGGYVKVTSGTTTITDESPGNWAIYTPGTFTHNDGNVSIETQASTVIDMDGESLYDIAINLNDVTRSMVFNTNTAIDNDLIIGSGTVNTASGTKTMTVTGDVVIENGDLFGLTAQTADVSFGSLTINSGGTYSATSGTTTINDNEVAGYNFRNQGTFTHNNGEVSFTGGGHASGSTAWDFGGNTTYDVTINIPGDSAYLYNNDFIVENNLTITNANLVAINTATDSINVTGDVVVNAGTLGGNSQTGDNYFGSLTINSAGGTYDATTGTTLLLGNTSVTGTLVGNKGNYNASPYNLTIASGGIVSNISQLNITLIDVDGWLNVSAGSEILFTDTPAAGFSSSSTANLTLLGNSTHPVNVTTAGKATPTNKWDFDTVTNPFCVTADYTNFDYFNSIRFNGEMDIDNSNFSYGSSVTIYNFQTVTSFTNNVIDNSVATAGAIRIWQATPTNLDNVVITNTGGANPDIRVDASSRVELNNSNFDFDDINLQPSAGIISKNHNDVARDYIIAASTLAKSDITNDFSSEDNVTIHTGGLSIDEVADAYNFTIKSGASANATQGNNITLQRAAIVYGWLDGGVANNHTLNGGVSPGNVNDIFSVKSGGTYNATTGNTTVKDSFQVSGGGTYNHNNGTFVYDCSTGAYGQCFGATSVGSKAFYNAYVKAGMWTANYPMEWRGNLSIESGATFRNGLSFSNSIIVLGTNTSSAHIKNYGTVDPANTARTATIKPANSSFPIIATGDDWDWDNAAGSVINISHADIQFDATTGGNGVTVIFGDNMTIDAFTVSAGDSLNVTNPGTHITGDTSKNLLNYGTLNAIGTAGNHINITTRTLNSYNNANLTLNYVTLFSDAGSTATLQFQTGITSINEDLNYLNVTTTSGSSRALGASAMTAIITAKNSNFSSPTTTTWNYQDVVIGDGSRVIFENSSFSTLGLQSTTGWLVSKNHNRVNNNWTIYGVLNSTDPGANYNSTDWTNSDNINVMLADVYQGYFASNLNASGDFTVADVIINNGSTITGNDFALNIDTLCIQGGGIYNATNGVTNLSAHTTCAGDGSMTFGMATGSLFNHNNGTFLFSEGTVRVRGRSGTGNFYNVNVTDSGTTWYYSTATIENNLSVGAGAFLQYHGSNDLASSVTGDVIVDGTLRADNDGSGNSMSYGSLTINSGGLHTATTATTTILGNTSVTGTIDGNHGNFNASPYNMSIASGGIVSNISQLNVTQISNSGQLNISPGSELLFTDAKASGFAASDGTLFILGNATHPINVTTAGKATPTNYWDGDAGMDITMNHTSLSYYTKFGDESVSGTHTYTINNCNFSYSEDVGFVKRYSSISSFTNNLITNSGDDGFRSYILVGNLNNITILNSGANDIDGVNNRLEFSDSNFDITNTNLFTTGIVASKNHNDVANEFYVAMASGDTVISDEFSINDPGSSDNLNLVIDVSPASSATFKLNGDSTYNALNISATTELDTDIANSRALTVTNNAIVTGNLTCQASAVSLGSLTVKNAGTYNATTGITTITSYTASAYYIDFQTGSILNNNNGLFKVTSTAGTQGLVRCLSTGNMYDLEMAQGDGDKGTLTTACTIDHNLTIDASSGFDTSTNNRALTVTGDASITGTLIGNAAAISLGSLIIESGGKYFVTTDTTTFTNSSANSSIIGNFSLSSGNVTNMQINATTFNISRGSNLELHNVIDIPSDPGSYANLGKYVNITNTSATSSALLNVSYDGTTPADEKQVSLMEYNDSWHKIKSASLDQTNNWVSANVTAFSIFAPFDLGAACSVDASTLLQDHLSCTTLNVTATGELNSSTYNVTATGDVNVTGTINGGTGEHSFGSLNVDGTYNATTGVTNITSEHSGGYAINLKPGSSWGKFYHNNGILSINTQETTSLYWATCSSNLCPYNVEFDLGDSSRFANINYGSGFEVANNLNIRQGIFKVRWGSTGLGHVIVHNSGTLNTNVGGYNHIISSLTINSGGTYDATSGTTTITSETAGGYAFDNDGTLTANSGILNFTNTVHTIADFVGTGNPYDVEIASSSARVTFDGNTIIDNNLNISSSNGIFRANSAGDDLTVTADVDITGILGHTAVTHTGAYSFGSLAINSGGQYNATSGVTTITNENDGNNATHIEGILTHNNGVFNFTHSGTANISWAGIGNFYDVQIADGTYDMANNWSAENDLNVTSGNFYANRQNLTVSGDVRVTAGLLDGDNGNATFGSLAVSSGATYRGTDNTHTTQITSADPDSFCWNIDGTYTNSNENLVITTNGKCLFDGGNQQTQTLWVDSGTSLILRDGLFYGHDVYLRGDLDTQEQGQTEQHIYVDDDMHVQGGGLTAHALPMSFGSLTLWSGGNYSATNGTTNITNGNVGMLAGSKFAANEGLLNVTYNGGSLTIVEPTAMLHDFSICNSGTTTDNSDNTAMNGTLTVCQDSTFVLGGFTWNLSTVDSTPLQGNGTITSTHGALEGLQINPNKSISLHQSNLDLSGAYVEIMGDNTITAIGNLTFGALAINSSAKLNMDSFNLSIPTTTGLQVGMTTPGNLTFTSGNLTVDNNVTIAGTSWLNGGYNSMTMGSLTINANGVYNATRNITTLTANNSANNPIVIDGTFTHNSGKVNITNNANMTMNISGTGNLFDLEIAVGEINNITLLDNTTLEGGLNISSGILDTNISFDHRFVVTGNAEINGTLHGRNSQNITFNSLNLTGTYNATSGITTLAGESPAGRQLYTGPGTLIHNNGTIRNAFMGVATIWRVNDTLWNVDTWNNAGSISLNTYGLNVENNLTLKSTIVPGGLTVNVTGDAAIDTGRFSGSTGTHYFGSLRLGTGGTFIATSDIITITANDSLGHPITLAAGTFTHNSGIVNITNPNANMSMDISDATGNLYDLQIVIGGNNLTLLDNTDLEGNLNITSGILDTNVSGGYRLTVPGDVDVSGTLQCGNSSNITFGSLTVNMGATYNATSNVTTITSENPFGYAFDIVHATFTHNDGKVNITTQTNTTIYAPGEEDSRFFDLEIATGAFNATLLNHTIVEGGLNISGGVLDVNDLADYNLTVQGNVTIAGKLFGWNSSNITFGSLRISPTGIYSATSNVTAITSKNVNNNATYIEGTLLHNNGVFNFTNPGAANISLLGTNRFYDVQIATGTYQMSNNWSTDNDFNLTSGIFDTNSQNLTSIGDVRIFGTLTGSSGEHSLGSLAIRTGGNYDATPSMTIITSEDPNGLAIDLDGTIDANLGLFNITTQTNTTIDLTGTNNFHDIEIATAGYNVTLLDNASLAGGLNITSGVLDTNLSSSYNLTVKQEVMINGTLYGRDANNITFGSLIISSAGIYNATNKTTTIDNENAAGFAFENNGTLTHNNGTLNITSSNTEIDTTGTSGNLWNIEIAASTVNITSNLTVDNNLTIAREAILNTTYGNISTSGFADIYGTLHGITAYLNFTNLTIKPTGNYSATSLATTINNDFITDTGGIFTHNLGDIIFDRGNFQNLSGAITLNNITLDTANTRVEGIRPTIAGIVTLSASNTNLIVDNYANVANDYKIWATSLTKSQITNDFANINNVTVINGTLLVDEAANTNNFTVYPNAATNLTGGNLLNITDWSRVFGVLNSTSGVMDVNKSLTVENTGIFLAPQAGNNFLSAGNITVIGAFQHESGAITFDGRNATVQYLNLINNTAHVYNITLLHTNTDVVLQNNTILRGNLTIETGAIATLTGGNNLTTYVGHIILNGILQVEDGLIFNATINATKFELNASDVRLYNIVTVPNDGLDVNSNTIVVLNTLNITNTSTTSVMDLNVSYGRGFTESALSIAKHNGTWYTLISSRDTERKLIASGNIDQFSTFALVTSVAPPPTPPSTTVPGAALGGGLGLSPFIKELDIKVTPEKVEEEVIVGKPGLTTLIVENIGNDDIEVDISLGGTITGLAALSTDKLTLKKGETKQIQLFLGPAETPGAYFGKVIFAIAGKAKEVPVILEVETLTKLFDVMLDIPSTHKVIAFGEPLKIQVTLLNVGPKEEKTDVTLHYLVRDFEGNTFYSESETVAVGRQKSFPKTIMLPPTMQPDSYVVAIELIYSNDFAIASSMFTLVSSKIPLLEYESNMLKVVAVAFALIILVMLRNRIIQVAKQMHRHLPKPKSGKSYLRKIKRKLEWKR